LSVVVAGYVFEPVRHIELSGMIAPALSAKHHG
jgi:hypothetical protein